MPFSSHNYQIHTSKTIQLGFIWKEEGLHKENKGLIVLASHIPTDKVPTVANQLLVDY